MEEVYVIYEHDGYEYCRILGFVTSEEKAEKICEEHNKDLQWYEEKASYKTVRSMDL